MSRTHKDRPHWVRLNDRNEKRVAHHDHIDYWGNDVDCDIDSPIVREDKYCVDRNCSYEIEGVYLWEETPSRRMRHYEWFGPVRAKTRDAMVSQVKEYNTYGIIETDSKEPDDHRNAPIKGCWG